MSRIPKDSIILLSYVNTQLRDHYSSFEALCDGLDADGEEIKASLSGAGYEYDPEQNRFR